MRYEYDVCISGKENVSRRTLLVYVVDVGLVAVVIFVFFCVLLFLFLLLAYQKNDVAQMWGYWSRRYEECNIPL